MPTDEYEFEFAITFSYRVPADALLEAYGTTDAVAAAHIDRLNAQDDPGAVAAALSENDYTVKVIDVRKVSVPSDEELDEAAKKFEQTKGSNEPVKKESK